jgi:dTDP-4-amino-4,6-dideoxygalactose transaminase
MRQYGWASKYSIEAAHGRNSRLDEMQAAILRIKLPMLDAGNQRRRDIHAVYEAAVAAGSQSNQLRPVNHANERFIAHLAVLESDDRAGARASLDAAGVKTDVHYPIPDHKQKWPDFTPRHMPLDVTERVANRIFSVPMFPELTDAEVARVADGLSAL